MKYPKLTKKGKIQLKRYTQEVWGLLRLRLETELWRGLSPILKEAASVGCTFHELWLLYKSTCEEKPSYILECGSGISTVVIGYAVKKVRKEKPCQLISMEESAKYYEDINNRIPAEVRDCLEIVLSPLEDRNLDDGTIARCYAEKPKHAYDLVFVDGPQIPSKKEDPRYFDGDLMDVVEWNEKPITVFLDNRETTRQAFLKLYPYAKHEYASPHRFSTFRIPASNDRS